MKKKEILEKLNNLKIKYIYQRYNGIITKYEVRDNYLIDTGNANNTIDITTQIPLGETSENIIDLIEVGDILKVHIFADKNDEDSEDIETTWKLENKYEIPETKGFIKENYGELLSILTHEQYEQNCYKVVE